MGRSRVDNVGSKRNNFLLSSDFSCLELVGSCFRDFSSLKASHADPDPADGPVLKAGLDALEIGEESAAGNAGDFFTDSTCFLGKTAAGNRTSHERFFIADGAMIHKGGIIVRRTGLASPFFL